MRADTRGIVRREIEGAVGILISPLNTHKAFVVEVLGLLEYIVPYQQLSVSIDNYRTKRSKGFQGEH